MVGVRPGDVLDRYRIERVLGSGGSGTVLQARHVHLGSGHAVKLLHVVGEAHRERLLREGRIQAGLRHPGIVGVTDVIAYPEGVATVMELVEGPDLYTWLSRHRPSAEEVDQIGDQLLAALACAHAAGVVHRDLKPDNVLVERRGAELYFRLTDFGLACLSDDPTRATRDGVAMGTPGYMAPEQFRDARGVDTRADLYSLGAVLYELLAGRPPVTATGIVEAYQEAVRGAHPAVATLAPEAPGRMAEAIEAALRVDPEQRPATVDALRKLWRGNVPPPGQRWSRAALEACTPVVVEGLHVPTLAPTAAIPSPPPVAVAPAARSWPTWARVAAFIGGALLLTWLPAASGLAVLVYESLRSAPGATAEVAADNDAPPTADAAPTGGPESTAHPAATADPAPTSAPAPTPAQPGLDSNPGAPPAAGANVAATRPTEPPREPSPSPSTVTPAPADPPAARPSGATVRVTGAADPVLVGADGRKRAAGRVPAGSYALHVRFGQGDPVKVLTLDLADGDSRDIRCTASLKVCE